MNFWDRITGNDLTREWKAFDARAAVLPAEYQAAWAQMKTQLFNYGDFSGRNLTPIADGASDCSKRRRRTGSASTTCSAMTSTASAQHWPAAREREAIGTAGGIS